MNMCDFLSESKSEIISLFVGAIIAIITITFVIGRNKFKWLTYELLKMYSGDPSFFSKKRIESGIAFSFAFWMTAYYLMKNIIGMDIWSFGYVLSVWLFIAGYTVSQIQSEKKINGKVMDNSGNGGNESEGKQ